MAQASMPEHVLQVGKAPLAAWGPAETLQVVGKSLPKRSGFDKVTGRARYAFDVQLPGMLYGAIVSPNEFRDETGLPESRIRQADEFSLAAVALAARVQAGTCIDCRVALGGVVPRPYRATAAEEAIKGSPLTAEQINKAAAAALADAKPMAMNTSVAERSLPLLNLVEMLYQPRAQVLLYRRR